MHVGLIIEITPKTLQSIAMEFSGTINNSHFTLDQYDFKKIFDTSQL